MEVLKAVVIAFVLIVIVNGAEEETKRQARCGSSGGRNNFKRKPFPQAKPIGFQKHGNHKFNHNRGKNPLFHNSGMGSSGSAFANAGTNIDNTYQQHSQNPSAHENTNQNNNNAPQFLTNDKGSDSSAETHDWNTASNGDASTETQDWKTASDGTASAETDDWNADASQFPDLESFGISPRISISPDGDVKLGRSLNLKRHFHDDDHYEHNHDHTHHDDEDHDHFHKIRTSRSTNEQQLAAQLSGLGTSLQTSNTNNQVSAGDTHTVFGSGNYVQSINQGSSNAAGHGTTYSTASTNISSS